MLSDYIPDGTNAELLRRTEPIRYRAAAYGKQKQELLYAREGDLEVRLEPGNKSENRKVFVSVGATKFAPAGAGLWKDLERAAVDGAREGLTALSLLLLRTGYLVDFESNPRWTEGDPIFNIRPPEDLLRVAEAELPTIRVEGANEEIEVTPRGYLAIVDAIGFAEDVKYVYRYEAEQATPNPDVKKKPKNYFQLGTGRPNSVLTSANCAHHCVERTLTTMANQLGLGRGVAPLDVNAARRWLN